MDKNSQPLENKESGEVSVEALRFAQHFLDGEEQKVDQDRVNPDESSLPPEKRARQSSLAYQEALNSTDSSQSDEEVADDDQAIYCTCKQISFGRMVLCDNKSCEIGWYHFPCVGVKKKPKGRWFCPQCRLQKSKSQPTPGTSSEASCSKEDKTKTIYLCPLCNFICFLPKKLEDHKLAHLNKKLFKCEHCEFVTALESIFMNHIKDHPENKLCTICKFRVEDPNTLPAHVAAHEPDAVDYKDVRGRIRNFKCAICNYRGLNLKGLRSHVKIHGKSSNAVHDGYSCGLCDYKTTSIVIYKQHVTSHTRCLHCEYICVTKEELVLHMRSFHREEIASSSKDDCGTRSNEAAPSHYDHKLYLCRFCTCRFGMLSELREHIRTHK